MAGAPCCTAVATPALAPTLDHQICFVTQGRHCCFEEMSMQWQWQEYFGDRAWPEETLMHWGKFSSDVCL